VDFRDGNQAVRRHAMSDFKITFEEAQREGFREDLVVDMPCCGFAFSTDHTDDRPGPKTFTCPICSQPNRDLLMRIANALELIANAFEPAKESLDAGPAQPEVGGVQAAGD
jgi:hypothetical protein